MFFFAAGAVALFVHNLCTFGFFCLSIYCLLFIDKKKKYISPMLYMLPISIVKETK